MRLLHPHDTDKAPQKATFLDPGAGTGENLLQKWLIALYDKMSQGKTQDVLDLLKEKGIPSGVPLTTSVLSSEEGVEACFALPLACLMTSRTPEKVIKTLVALEKKGYVWRTTCTLEQRPLPWETACALAWLTTHQRLGTNPDRQKRLSTLMLKKSVSVTKKEASAYQCSPARLRHDARAFVRWQGGDPESLALPDQMKAFVALSVYTANPLCPRHVGVFLSEKDETLLKEAWITPWQPTLPSPAEKLAHRLWACVSLVYHTPVVHCDEGRRLTVPSPGTLLRCWRRTWDTPPIPETEARAQLDTVKALMSETVYEMRHTGAYGSPYLNPYKERSQMVAGWLAVPGGTYALRHLNTLEPLPQKLLPQGLLMGDWHLDTREKQKEVAQQFARHTAARKKQMHLPPSALKGGWYVGHPTLFSATSSGNKVVMVSPYEPTSPLTPSSVKQVSTEEGGSAERVQQSLSQGTEAPTAADVLMSFNTWLNTPGTLSPTTKTFVDTLRAFEKHEGAPFTFRVEKDERRWSLHGYLWARGTLRGEEASRILSSAGYPPCPFGYSLAQRNDQGKEETHVEPFGVCVLQRFNTLITENLRSPQDASAGLCEPLRDILTGYKKIRLSSIGYVLDLHAPTASGLPLYQTAFSVINLHNAFPLYLWMVDQGVPLHGAEVILDTIKKRVALGEESTTRRWWKKEEALVNINALVRHLEQRVLADTLQENKERSPEHVTARTSTRPRI